MKIKELKAIIENLDDNIDIGATGHFGEFLECYGAELKDVYEGIQSTKAEKRILHLNIELPCNAPD